MRYAWLGCWLWGSLLIAGNQQPDINVNCRYIVESVEITGHHDEKISSGLRQDMNRLVGEKVDPESVDNLAKRIRKELHVSAVTHKLLKGDEAEHVKIVFDAKGPSHEVDLNITNPVYHSKEGFSGGTEFTTKIASNAFTAGLVSDGDTTLPRYTGVTARYENTRLGTDRVGLRFDFGSYHTQWNPGTVRALALQPAGAPEAVPGIYRTAQEFSPGVNIKLAKPLTLTVKMRFVRFQTQYPQATFQGSDTVSASLALRQTMKDADANQHDVSASYGLTAATRVLASDFVWVRHAASVRYSFKRGEHVLADEAQAGMIDGQAPIFERFVLGTAYLLRGWNKYDLDPLGGSRMVHNSLEYRYHWFEIFYDTGAIWSRNEDIVQRHSLGLGIRDGSFFLAVAFPVKSGRADPVFMVGMNY